MWFTRGATGARDARRVVLATGVAAVLASTAVAQPRVGGEVAVGGYGGSVSGYTAPLGCASAGIARGTIGGAAMRARVRVREHPGPGSDKGFVVEVQGGVEHRAHTAARGGGVSTPSIPEDGALLGGALTVGYDWRWIGLHGGVLAREVVGPATEVCWAGASMPCVLPPRYANVAVHAFPQGVFRFGRLDRVYGEVGVGAHDPALVLRPWAYHGLHVALAPGAELALRVGAQWTFADNVPLRFDLAATIPLGRRFGLGLGAGIVAESAGMSGDGRASLAVRFKS